MELPQPAKPRRGPRLLANILCPECGGLLGVVLDGDIVLSRHRHRAIIVRLGGLLGITCGRSGCDGVWRPEATAS